MPVVGGFTFRAPAIALSQICNGRRPVKWATAEHWLPEVLKKVLRVPLQLHTHYTAGLASMSYLKAAEAGVDAVDTALAPFAMALVPAWWPEFCSGYDVAAGAYLAWLLKSGRVRATS